MRWQKKYKTYPKEYSTRIKRGFLFFPKIIDREYRWLEYTAWEQRRVQSIFGEGYVWMNESWVNECKKI